MKNTENTTYTFWKEIATGCIYKYEFGTKPYRADEGRWVEVSGWDYDRQFNH